MVRQAVVQRPSDLAGAFSNIHESSELELCLTLRVYKSLEEDNELHQESDTHPLGVELLEPLYHAWALALRDVQTPAQSPRLRVKIILDLTRPPIEILNFGQYEARGLARIAALLRQKFRNTATLQATIEGAPCWCVLRTCEKHTAALPKAESWPVSRASHNNVNRNDSRGLSKCLSLAKEHWDDEYWGHLEKT